MAIKMETLLTEMRASGVARDDLPGCLQIKEKFGELRIYWREWMPLRSRHTGERCLTKQQDARR